MVDARIMCRSHLLGEHAEVHMFVGALCRRQSVEGYLKKGLLEVHSLFTRHEELVEEMKRRGYRHRSDLDEKWRYTEVSGSIDRKKSFEELVNRCPRCRRMYYERNRSP
jgi:uncharacterized protein with PIN domain